MSRSALIVALVAALAAPAAAAVCTMPADAKVETYWPVGKVSVAAGDRRCDPGAGGPTCRLRGWLFKPAGAGAGHPAIVYIHGSGKKKRVDDLCEMIRYFVDDGFVVWVPYPRGYSDPTPGVHLENTGTDIVTYLDGLGSLPEGKKIDATVDEMNAEIHAEIADALDWLVGQSAAGGAGKLVDPHKIALAGHSFGGLTVMLAAQAKLATMPAAIIDMSGGVLSWPTAPKLWEQKVGDGLEGHNQPIFLFQTPNESPAGSIASTVDPFLHANGHGTGSSQMAVFSDVPDIGTDPKTWPSYCDPGKARNECVHLAFVRDHQQVMRWAPDVQAFLAHYGIKK